MPRPPPKQLDTASATATNAPAARSGTNATHVAPSLTAPPTATNAPAATPTETAKHESAEQRLVLSNHLSAVTLSSWGGGVVSAELKQFRQAVDDDSGPVRFDFASHPALAMVGWSEFSTNRDFTVQSPDATTGVVERVSADGLRFRRTLALEGEYGMAVVDVFSNATGTAISLPEHSVRIGPMRPEKSLASSQGAPTLGLDSLADQGGSRVHFWGDKDLPNLFGGGGFGCSRSLPVGAPVAVTHRAGSPTLWLAAKNKFFVQILAPAVAATDAELRAARDPDPRAGLTLSEVSGGLVFAGRTLQPGERHERRYHLYVGPKKYAVLAQLGHQQDEVMQFGWFSWLCKKLLWILNLLYRLIPNYGIAIILLTFLVRLVFWPVTQKSNESMKKMQKIQPQIAKLREKFKSDPQKLNQATMQLYRENKVNPMMGCLPMLIQIPVFFALFVVLRSAVELRFAGFLWVRDLSEPEGLLAGMIPFVHSLNILPLVMTATMVWQQHLTPTAGDPAQQKMMLIAMPIIFLFMLYNMPSALVLYWTVSQCLAIAQLVMQRPKNETAPARKPA
jgi:YidC/Oxa1 family membrane protein insertase